MIELLVENYSAIKYTCMQHLRIYLFYQKLTLSRAAAEARC